MGKLPRFLDTGTSQLNNVSALLSTSKVPALTLPFNVLSSTLDLTCSVSIEKRSMMHHVIST